MPLFCITDLYSGVNVCANVGGMLYEKTTVMDSCKKKKKVFSSVSHPVQCTESHYCVTVEYYIILKCLKMEFCSCNRFCSLVHLYL